MWVVLMIHLTLITVGMVTDIYRGRFHFELSLAIGKTAWMLAGYEDLETSPSYGG